MHPPSLEQREPSERQNNTTAPLAARMDTTAVLQQALNHQTNHEPQLRKYLHPDDEHDVPELHVRIVTTLDDPYSDSPYQTLDIRLDELHRREEEMLHVARTFAVPIARWNGSRLYKFYRGQKDAQKDGQLALPLVLTLDPTAFCRDQHLSKVFSWKPWLGEMMQSYMHSGVLSVNREATGDDWLICCEYFGILYQPSQVVFETLQAYQNVAAWSEYLSKRCELAEWVAEGVLRKRQTVFFVAHQDEGWTAEVDQQQGPATMLSDGKHPTLSSFFHDDDHPVEGTTRQFRMRQDFCGYMEHVLSHVECRFDMELVTLSAKVQRYAPRAVLRIRLLLHPPPPPSPKKTRQDLPFPVDELVAEDLQSGTLEKLVQQVDARNAPLLMKPNIPKPSATQIAPHSNVTNQVVARTWVETIDAKQAQIHEPQTLLAMKVQPPHVRMQKQAVEGHNAVPHLSVDGLPFNIIRTHSNGEGNQSVTSALTGPYLYDEDGSLKDTNEYYEGAGTNNWWNRDNEIQGRVKALLDDATTDVDTSKGGQEKAATRSATDEVASTSDDQWEWLTALCNFPSTLVAPQLAKGSHQSLHKGESHVVDSLSCTKATQKTDDPKRMATLLALQTKAAEVRSQKNPPKHLADTVQGELRVVALHTDAEAEQKRNLILRAPDTPCTAVRTPSPRSPESPAESSVSSEDGPDHPQPPPRIRNRMGYESHASSTVSAAIKPKSRAESIKIENGRKRPVIKSLFRRRKSDRGYNV